MGDEAVTDGNVIFNSRSIYQQLMIRSVALLCLDTVRKDYYDECSTRLRSRAETTLERCYAASGWSMPSHANIFAGELPYEHGIHLFGSGHQQDIPGAPP
jgi:hypothetical protein